MSKSHRFDCGDGTITTLNSRQLMALLGVPRPPQNTSWPTYWALRNRRLIEGTSPAQLTVRGEAVIEDYKRKCRGR